ncbi:MAG: hypothetical protein M1827_001217 [Pycnora praestabilis]|nr:MAG: hypothetical protein M1827_001217 [Pycnora praestabilis]
MPTRTAISTDKAPLPLPYFSQGIVCNGMVHCSGQIGNKGRTDNVLEGGVGDRTAQALRNLSAILEEAGSSLKNVVSVRIFLITMENFAAMNKVYDTFFEDPKPCSNKPNKMIPWDVSTRKLTLGVFKVTTPVNSKKRSRTEDDLGWERSPDLEDGPHRFNDAYADISTQVDVDKQLLQEVLQNLGSRKPRSLHKCVRIDDNRSRNASVLSMQEDTLYKKHKSASAVQDADDANLAPDIFNHSTEGLCLDPAVGDLDALFSKAVEVLSQGQVVPRRNEETTDEHDELDEALISPRNKCRKGATFRENSRGVLSILRQHG